MTPSLSLPPQYQLVAYDAIDSVVDEARRLAEQGAEEGTLVWAKQQSAARGRFERPWLSPAGNLYCALILRLEEPPAAALQVSYVAAVSLGATIAELIGPAELHYRWPNDILLNEVKVAGLMLAAPPRSANAAYDWLVLGVAVNVNTQPAAVEAETVAAHSDRFGGVPETLVLEDFARHFLSWINRWADEGFTPVQKAWQLRAHDIGHATKVKLRDETLEGQFIELDGEGAMIMQTPDAGRRKITLAEFYGV